MRSSSLPLGFRLGSVSLRYRSRLAEPPSPASHIARQITSSRSARTDIGELQDRRLQRLEAILFLAQEPISSRKLSKYANLADGTEALTLIRRLNQQYEQRGRAFRVEEVGGGMQLFTRPRFAGWLRRLSGVPGELRLSGPAMETLAVVAYRQPVSRATIEAVRGVSCSEILRQLIERELVHIFGRSDELGRPYLYSTTRHFLQVFGLRHLDELPDCAALSNIASSQSPSETNDKQNTPDPEQPQSEEERKVTVASTSESNIEELQPAAVASSVEVTGASAEEDDDDEWEEEDVYEDEKDDEDEEYDEDEWEEVEDDEEEEFEEDEEYDEEWEDSDDDDEEEWEEDDDEDDKEEEDENNEEWK